MQNVKTGLFSITLYFELSEKEQYNSYKEQYKGYYTETFINNGYALEITKRVVKG